SASRAISFLAASQPVADWMQHGTAAVAEVLLTMREAGGPGPPGSRVELGRQARQAVRAMRRFARRFPVGGPHALLWRGLLPCPGRARAAHAHRDRCAGGVVTPAYVQRLRCPRCEARLAFDGTLRGAELDTGTLRCRGCGVAWPVHRGLPDLVDGIEIRGFER